MKNLNKSLLLASLVCFSMAAHALDSEEALIESCQEYYDQKPIPEDTICYEYVTGFIDGAILTDTAIIANIKKERKEFSTFFERAYKTRVGKTRKELPVTYFAKFCLPEDQTRHQIVEELVYSIDANELKDTEFKHVLYNTLRRVYSCE